MEALKNEEIMNLRDRHNNEKAILEKEIEGLKRQND
jgi:hypothetical protein